MSTTETKRPRGRPRSFDGDAALDAALATFWTRGYAGTSMDHLTTAMDLNRPSVYAAFGSKEGLYAASVTRYVDTVGRGYLAAFESGAGLAKELEAFYGAVIRVVTGGHGPRGCIVACTLPVEASEDARELLAGEHAGLDAAVARRFTAAKASGELPASSDPRTLAQVVTSGMLAISIRGRAGATPRELRRLARAFIAMVTAA